MRPRNLLSAALCLIVATPVLAQNFPNKPVRMIVPFAPGGVLDGLLWPIANMKTLVEYARANPGKLNFGSFGEKILTPQFYTPVGNTPEQFTEFLKGERELAAMLVKISGLKPFD